MQNSIYDLINSCIGLIYKKKKRGKIFLLFLFLCVGLLFLVHHDSFLYKNQLVGKIVSVKNIATVPMKKEATYQQTLKVKLLNGKNKGDIYTLVNSYTSSNVKSAKYKVKDELLLEKNSLSKTNELSIISLKRDTTLVSFILFFTAILLVFVGKRTLFLLLSFFGNMVLYMFNLFLYQKGVHLGTLTCVFMVVQTIFTLYVLDGRSEKVRLTVISSLLSIAVTFLLYYVISKFTSPLPYYMFDYLSVSDKEKQNLFMASVIFGGVGAVMDVCITICSLASELSEMKSSLNLGTFFHSLSQTGTDIMGTMQCVLLFSYLTSAIPMMVMKLASGSYVISVLKFDFSFELVRFLTGSIAIVFAVLFSSYFSCYFYYGIKQKNCSFLLFFQSLRKEKNRLSTKERKIQK